MLYVDIPSSDEIAALTRERAEGSVSIYVATTPVTQEIGKSRIALGNMVKTAIGQLEANGLDKRRLWPLQEYFEGVLADDEYWQHQAHSLAILATPDRIRTYRLANKLTDMVRISDRFHLKPLLRAITFPHSAHILALSENAVRMIEMSSDLPATEIRVPNLPKDAASAVGKSTINDRSPSGRIQGLEGQKVRLTQYIRKIDAALRPVLANSGTPLVLASTLPLASLFRAHSALAVLPQTVEVSPDQMSDAELANAARPVLDAHYQGQIEEFQRLFEDRKGLNRATSDISDAARLATFGGIDTLLVDFDSITAGQVDEDTGAVTFAADGDAGSYGVVDEIVGRALRSGARVLAVRQSDIPGGRELAAILRYPI
ncbi:MAG: hypothetical protein ABI216_20005 [Devosia sp.]